MKKRISILFAIILLFSCFGFTTYAAKSINTISEDYQTMTVEGNNYSRFNASMLYLNTSYSEIKMTLSTEQKKNINSIQLESSKDLSVISVDINFKDGSRLLVDFLRDDLIEEYHSLLNDSSRDYRINFGWPDGNIVMAKGTTLLGNDVELKPNVLEWCAFYEVSTISSDESMSMAKGSILSYEDTYYYVDFEECGITDAYIFDPYEYQSLLAHKITDEKLEKKLSDAETAYYQNDMGFLDNDDFTESVSAVFLIIVFAIIPFIILIVCLIFAIRTKNAYRKLFSVVCILSGIEMAIFAISTILIMTCK